MVEIAANSTGWNAGSWEAEGNSASWLPQTQQEIDPVNLQNLLDTLYSLGSQLSALQTSLQSSRLVPQIQVTGPELANDGRWTMDDGQLSIHPPLSNNSTTQAQQDVVIKVSLLGPFQLYARNRNLGPSIPRQVRTVLEYLLSQGRRPTSKDALLDLLWPDANPTVACSRLRVVMHTLRKSIPCDGLGFQDLVVMTGNNFVINPDAKLLVDVEEFERRWLKGWRLAKSGRTQEALAEYEQAEALYTGDCLEDEPYADWTLLRREALRDAYANILTMLATMSLEAGDYTGAIIWSQKLLAQDNCREDAYRLLMISHRKLGQTSRAAHWYNLCAWALQRELGMEPSAETQELYNQL